MITTGQWTLMQCGPRSPEEEWEDITRCEAVQGKAIMEKAKKHTYVA